LKALYETTERSERKKINGRKKGKFPKKKMPFYFSAVELFQRDRRREKKRKRNIEINYSEKYSPR